MGRGSGEGEKGRKGRARGERGEGRKEMGRGKGVETSRLMEMRGEGVPLVHEKHTHWYQNSLCVCL